MPVKSFNYINDGGLYMLKMSYTLPNVGLYICQVESFVEDIVNIMQLRALIQFYLFNVH